MLLFLFSLVFNLHAQTSNLGHKAYYGSDFFQTNHKNLKVELYNILSSFHKSQKNDYDQILSSCSDSDCYRFSSVGYERARDILFGELFFQADNTGAYVEDVYCHKKIYFKTVADVHNMGNIVNIEHTWPQSKFSTSFDKNLQKSDLHHLFPTDSKANGTRGNYEFGEAFAHEELDKLCHPSQLTEISGHFVFTPPSEHKGNIARALFYFSIRYKLPIGEAEELILRQWHRVDPVDQAEIDRAEKIFAHQKNRNPFIDFPELADEIKDF